VPSDLVRDQPDGLDHGACTAPLAVAQDAGETAAAVNPPKPSRLKNSNKERDWLPRPGNRQTGHPTEEIVRDRLYIGGQWVEPAGSETIEVIDSTTEQVIGRIPEGTPEDVDRAVKAARAGFEEWREVPVEQRVEVCTAISAALAERADEIAGLIAAEVGMPGTARTIRAGLPAGAARWPRSHRRSWEEQIGNSLVVREPVGGRLRHP
jgi:hypothetical protein